MNTSRIREERRFVENFHTAMSKMFTIEDGQWDTDPFSAFQFVVRDKCSIGTMLKPSLVNDDNFKVKEDGLVVDLNGPEYRGLPTSLQKMFVCLSGLNDITCYTEMRLVVYNTWPHSFLLVVIGTRQSSCIWSDQLMPVMMNSRFALVCTDSCEPAEEHVSVYYEDEDFIGSCVEPSPTLAQSNRDGCVLFL